MDIVNQICGDTPGRKSKPAPRKNNKRKNNCDNRKDDTSPPKQRKRSTPKGKKNVSLEKCDDFTSRNESTASDYVPPTPPDPNRTVSTRTPNRSSLRNRTEPNRIEDSRRKSQKESANELKAPNNSNTLSKVTEKSENQEPEENKSLCEPSIPLTCQSFTIIDTAANKMLFEHFIEEWRRQEMYALSIACEKIPVQPGDIGRIGANFNKGVQLNIFTALNSSCGKVMLVILFRGVRVSLILCPFLGVGYPGEVGFLGVGIPCHPLPQLQKLVSTHSTGMLSCFHCVKESWIPLSLDS